MIEPRPYRLIVQWRDSAPETLSDHPTLQDATREAFRVADRLSLRDSPRSASEVAVVREDDLQLSIIINPGDPLTKRIE